MGSACSVGKETDIADKGTGAIVQGIANNTNDARTDLSNRKFGLKGAQVVANALETNTTLTTLFLSWNNIQDAGLECLVDALTKPNSCPSLRTLILSGNNLTDASSQHICTLLTAKPQIQHLSLSANQFTLTGAEAILRTIGIPEAGTETNRSPKPKLLSHTQSTASALHSLSFGGNKIVAPDFKWIIHALGQNTTLVSLEVRDNFLPPNTVDALESWMKERRQEQESTTDTLPEGEAAELQPPRPPQLQTTSTTLTSSTLSKGSPVESSPPSQPVPVLNFKSAAEAPAFPFSDCLSQNAEASPPPCLSQETQHASLSVMADGSMYSGSMQESFSNTEGDHNERTSLAATCSPSMEPPSPSCASPGGKGSPTAAD
eukprot:TRINITY_DN56234_c0_g1_i1.p1 TRINITY_DN56234_c0_g1~~TRINITY_DN56234_c0_g1_i1.p1  ORF type:complete len:375 (-),score=10.15 TRINITY_DN56234_c0_g1_i1:30-1154(-)